METKNLKTANPEETVNNTAQDSKTQPSAKEQKNNPQSNTTAEESKTVSKQEQGKNSGKPSVQNDLATPDILVDDTAQIFVWLENANQTPRQLKALLDTVDTKIELIEDILSKQSKQAQRVPGIDKRIETLELYGEQVETSDRYLSELNKIKLQTELTNLNEKRFQVWQKFVKACGSEKKALKYQNLRAKAKSSFYHSKSSYFVKQRILKILNTILKDDKSGLEEVKNLADNSSDASIKLFNEKMRDLLDVYDEDLVILCSHFLREFYFNIMRLTLVKWNPEADLEITELADPNES
jgi:hypothetical protein